MAELISMLAATAGQGGVADVDPNFNQTVLLLHGDGTDGMSNTDFEDSSTNNFTITRNGNTTQGTFSPFSAPDGRWSNYFDGSGDRLSWSGSTVGTNAFSFECWIYLNSVAEYATLGSTNTSGGLTVRVKTSTSIAIDALNVSGVNYTVPTITANTWHHLVACRNASNETTVFWNGVRSSSGVQTDTRNFAVSNLIGAVQRTSVEIQLNGYLSNARLLIGSSAYDPTQTTITVPTAPLTAITNTSLLTCQSNRFADNSTNNFAITPAGNARVTPFSPFAPTAAYDASVNGGSGYFDGVNDYLSIADDVAFDLSNSAFTIEAWIYMTGGAGANRTIISQLNSSNSGAFLFYVNSSNKLSFFHNPGAVTSLTGATSLNLNEWIHVAVTRSGNDFALYINGTRDDTLTSTVTISASALDVTIGADVSSTRDLTGYISSLRWVLGTAIYDPADATITIPTSPLTAVANTSLLLSTTNAGIFDNTGKNNLETVADTQIDTAIKKYGTGSIQFDGTGDQLYIANSPELALGTGDFTVEMWYYENSGASGNKGLFDTRTIAGATDGFLLQRIDTLNLRVFTNASVVTTGSNTIVQATWQHIAVVRQSGTIRIYLDGVEKNNAANTQNFTNTDCWIGDNADQSQKLNGYLDDIRVTKGICRYPDGTTFTPPTKAFPDL